MLCYVPPFFPLLPFRLHPFPCLPYPPLSFLPFRTLLKSGHVHGSAEVVSTASRLSDGFDAETRFGAFQIKIRSWQQRFFF